MITTRTGENTRLSHCPVNKISMSEGKIVRAPTRGANTFPFSDTFSTRGRERVEMVKIAR